jgi:DNA primase
MALYTRDSIDRLRDAIDMVELVSTRTDLRRVGSRWTGRCPFHDERTPSFSVNAEEKLFYCFGCHVKGDAIGFVEQLDGLDFREAVETLADRYGVKLELENEDPQAEQRRRRRERLLALLERAARWYATSLWESDEARPARDYLSGRGLSEEILREFRVGYAPGAWDRLSTAAQRQGATTDELIQAGLAQRGRQGGLIDRFRGRIMFPLADARGRVLGFGARQMEEGKGPKYLNTSENELYHKRSQLFGIDVARAHAAKSGRIVVVEGYTDVLALHQAGVRDAVAIMGTALTDEQFRELRRAAPRVVLALDADPSGQEAMARVARSADDVELTVVEMPEGSDPAELVASEGAAAFEERLGRAIEVVRFQLRRVLADADLDTPTGRDRAIEEARALVAQEKPALRDDLIREAADRLDVPADYLGARRPAPAASMAAPAQSPGAMSLAAERAFLALCLASGEAGQEYLERLSPEHLSSGVTRRAREHLAASFDDPMAGLEDGDPEVGRAVMTVMQEADERGPATEAELRISFLALELRRIDRERRRAAEQGDLERQQQLAAARRDALREIDAVTGQTA